MQVQFLNQCTLTEVNLMLTWPDGLHLDSISTTGRLSDFNWNNYIFNDSNFADLNAVNAMGEPAGFGDLAILHFTVAADAPEGFYEVTRYDVSPNPRFLINCGNDDFRGRAVVLLRRRHG